MTRATVGVTTQGASTGTGCWAHAASNTDAKINERIRRPLSLRDGESARAVTALLGHKSPQMFLHYTKVEEQARAKTAALMDRILGAS